MKFHNQKKQGGNFSHPLHHLLSFSYLPLFFIYLSTLFSFFLSLLVVHLQCFFLSLSQSSFSHSFFSVLISLPFPLELCLFPGSSFRLSLPHFVILSLCLLVSFLLLFFHSFQSFSFNFLVFYLFFLSLSFSINFIFFFLSVSYNYVLHVHLPPLRFRYHLSFCSS